MIKKNTVTMAERKKARDKDKALKKGLVAVGEIAAVGAVAAIVLDPKVQEKKEEISEAIKDAQLKVSDSAEEASEAIKKAQKKAKVVAKEVKEGYKEVKHGIHKSTVKISKELNKKK